ncbi:transcriptional regulator [Nocardia terpenica]|uniref:transcriptional regulator n=1 Tax=Nocardia terpenica TaxID=455432 RepID=UPI003D16086A
MRWRADDRPRRRSRPAAGCPAWPSRGRGPRRGCPDPPEAGYVTTERRLNGARRKVRARLTDTGRDAFDGHVAALREIVAAATPPAADT